MALTLWHTGNEVPPVLFHELQKLSHYARILAGNIVFLRWIVLDVEQ